MKSFRSRYLALMFFMSLVFPTGAMANIFYKDDRQSRSITAGDPLSRIGRLSKEIDGSRGTAFLVGQCHILTNFHVTFADQSAPRLDEVLIFELGIEAPVKAHPIRHGNLNPGDPALSDQDWALLKLETCLGEKYGWFELEIQSLFSITKEPVILAGYPSDKTVDLLWVDFDCHIHKDQLPKKQKGGWRHDCASRPGNSGGPLLLQRGNNFVVIGLNVSEWGSLPEIFRNYDPYVANGAVPMSAILPFIQDLKDSPGF